MRSFRKDSGVGDKFVEELQVEVELQRLNNHTPKDDQSDQEDKDDEDAGNQATDQPSNLIDYQLVRDREPRMRTKPLRFRDESNMAAYAFVTAEKEDTHEPLTYQESVSYEDNYLAGKKLVSYKWLFKIKEGIEGVQNPRSYAPGEYIYLLLYVDDMLITHKSKDEIGSTKSFLKKEFDMKELGEAKKIIGIKIIKDWSRKILRVSQSEYVSKILNNFRIDNWKLVKMPLGGHFELSLKDCPVSVGN
nr:retrovirus-related Pol polyprotein from transposon TNT 1-94 [Tanacetum cinerariifolium]